MNETVTIHIGNSGNMSETIAEFRQRRELRRLIESLYGVQNDSDSVEAVRSDNEFRMKEAAYWIAVYVADEIERAGERT